MKILSGWKEIANHLHQGVRTVQRWEFLGLPIHRVRGNPRSQVIAFVEEVNAWEEATPIRTPEVIRKLEAKIGRLERELLALKRPHRRAKGARNKR